MSGDSSSTAVHEEVPGPKKRRQPLYVVFGVVALALVPLVTFSWFVVVTISRGILAYDARTGYLPAAREIAHGISPYPNANYPPLGFVLYIPFTAIPRPEYVLTVIAIAAVPAILAALDVSDWRCYAAAFLWTPVYSAVQTVNYTVFLGLAAALSWRWRNEVRRCAWATAFGIATKLITAPLLIWLFATGRRRTAVRSAALSAAVTVALLVMIQVVGGSGLWVDVDGSGLWVDKAVKLPIASYTPSYSAIDIMAENGLPKALGIGIILAVVAVLGLLSVRFARAGDDERAYAAAASAMIVFAPNVWLHSLTLLLLPLGVLRPRFDPLWLLPCALIVVGVGNPVTWEWIVFWGVGAAVVFRALSRPGSAGADLSI